MPQIKEFIKFYLEATTLYNVHSPFVYEFVYFLFKNRVDVDLENIVKTRRSELLNDHTQLNINDHGAGSSGRQNDPGKEVRRIAQTAVSDSMKGKWLYNSAAYFKPGVTLELGTSFGISSVYLARHSGHLVTMEGSEPIAGIATKTFADAKLGNIQPEVGRFEDILIPFLENNECPDLVFIDGNHTYEATTGFFNLFLKYRNSDNMVLIFDDIYWSEGMMQAWNAIRHHKDVHLTIDIFRMGWVFFKPEIIEPKNYKIVPTWWKPWHLGFSPVKVL